VSNFILRGKFIRAVTGSWIKKERIVLIRIVEEKVVDDKTQKMSGPYWVNGNDLSGNLFRLANFEVLAEAQEAAKGLVDILSDDQG
jgi:hypothetical protein